MIVAAVIFIVSLGCSAMQIKYGKYGQAVLMAMIAGLAIADFIWVWETVYKF